MPRVETRRWYSRKSAGSRLGLIRKIQPGSATSASDYDWTYKMAGMRLDGTNETTQVVPYRKMEAISRGGIESHWTWDFAGENGSTDLTVTVAYKVPVPVLGKLAEAIIVKQNDQESDVLLANLKTRMEAA